MTIRYRHINILKGLGIIAVVLGHVGAPFIRIIYMYHMALFFFISGYLYKESCEKNLFKYIFKKFKSLYVPFISFELILLLLRNSLIKLHIYNVTQIKMINSLNDLIEDLKSIITFNNPAGESMLGAVWFLRTLFYVSILYAIFNIIFKKLFKKNNEYLKCLIIISLTIISFELISKGYNLAMHLNPANKKVLKLFTDIFDLRNIIVMSIFYFGNLYKKNELKIPMNIYVAIMSLIIIYYNSKIATIDVAFYQFVSPIYFIINSLLGIYLNLFIVYKICNATLKYKLIEIAGKYSIYIMMLHLLSCKLIDVIIVEIYKMPLEVIGGYPVSFHGKYIWILYTIVGTLLPISSALFYNKIRLIIHKNYSKYNFGETRYNLNN